jgi:hypothetical protein
MLKCAVNIVLATGSVYAANLTDADLALVRGDRLWLANDRMRMTAAMDQLLQGCLMAAGIPPRELPSEVRAAGVSMFVHPVNWLTACTWLGESFSVTNEALGAESGKAGPTVRPMRPRQLYALTIEAFSEADQFMSKFNKQLNAVSKPILTSGGNRNA